MAAKDKVIEAARTLLARKFANYKAANGREIGIEADDGEKCWIVHSEDVHALESALAAYDKRRAELKETAALGG